MESDREGYFRKLALWSPRFSLCLRYAVCISGDAASKTVCSSETLQLYNMRAEEVSLTAWIPKDTSVYALYSNGHSHKLKSGHQHQLSAMMTTARFYKPQFLRRAVGLWGALFLRDRAAFPVLNQSPDVISQHP